MKSFSFAALAAAVLLVLVLSPARSFACACGCGVFDIGESALTPIDSASRFSAWFRYSSMDQNQNWKGAAKAPGADNHDKDIRTSFYTLGGQIMINSRWMVMAELPIYDRALTTTDDGTVFGPSGGLYTGHITAPGDLQLTAIYTGLSPDMSTGLTVGVKLPTGDHTGPTGPLGGAEFDRDSLPGTGSTDLMIGGYHAGKLGGGDAWSYFVQGRYQFAVAIQGDYRPGGEFDGAIGVSYDVGAVGPASKVAPVLQLLSSARGRDGGANADPLNSGYERLLIAPGIEARVKKVRLYADVELPIYQHVNAAPGPAVEGTAGQLTAPVLFKMQLGYDF